MSKFHLLSRFARKCCARVLVGAALLFVAFCSSVAQNTLTIPDALPPYKLTPQLLSNGHFSITTRYVGDSTKALIYREDGSSGRPVNYTSHVHFKVDNTVFQLPYEQDPVTRVAPPPNPLVVQNIFRDTLQQIPRINATLLAIMPDKDTVQFVFTMHPVKRSSGGFIRLIATVANSGKRAHSIGVLMMIDTKIGNNDQAPIATAFGYSQIEKDFVKGIAAGIPEFWLGMEGNPTQPGLVARGNLRASELIEPDYLLFGNWTDFTAQGIKGLAAAQWKERNATNNSYTDSAVLLVWDQEQFAPNSQRIKASTEIGIVDSLEVSLVGSSGGGGGGFGSGGGFGFAGASGCFSVERVKDIPCNSVASPYAPDSVQALYLVTSGYKSQQSNVRIQLGAVPAGVLAAASRVDVIPQQLDSAQTGVATVTFKVVPRLQDQQYEIPLAILNQADTVLLRDTVCITVPGIIGTVLAEDNQFPPVCPNTTDNLTVLVRQSGYRCLPISAIELLGAPSDVALFSIVNPAPTVLPADSSNPARIQIQFAPLVNNTTTTIKIAVAVVDSEVVNGVTTRVFLRDTLELKGISKEAEFLFARTTDTLDFGRVCVGTEAPGDWDILNTGGCALQVLSARLEDVNGQGKDQFEITNLAEFPLTIQRSLTGIGDTVFFAFKPTRPGLHRAYAIVQSLASPKLDTLILQGVAEIPAYTIQAVGGLDTLCPDIAKSFTLQLRNATACPVDVDTVRFATEINGWSVTPAGKLTIPPNSSISVVVRANSSVPIVSTANVLIESASASNRSYEFQYVVASRTATRSQDTLPYGDVFLNKQASLPLQIKSTGTARVALNSILVSGLHASEYSITLPTGMQFPIELEPNATVDITCTFVPKDIEGRVASLQFVLSPTASCAAIEPVYLKGRGIQPIVDVSRRVVDIGKVCIGRGLDTTISIRNIGNAPLRVLNVRSSNNEFQVIGGSNSVVDTASEQRVQVRYSPNTIGKQVTDIGIETDGVWINAADTVVSVRAHCVVCGELQVDTILASMGELIDIPVRFVPSSSLSASQIVRAMNDVRASKAQLSLLFDGSMLDVQQNVQSSASMIGLLPSAVASNVGSVDISIPAQVVLQESNLVALLRAEVLLGNDYQTPLQIGVQNFADSNFVLTTRNGLLRSQYCALDKRFVSAQKVLLYMRSSNNADEVVVYTTEKSSFILRVFSVQGVEVYSTSIECGNGQSLIVPLPSELASGLYLVSVNNGTVLQTTQFIRQ